MFSFKSRSLLKMAEVLPLKFMYCNLFNLHWYFSTILINHTLIIWITRPFLQLTLPLSGFDKSFALFYEILGKKQVHVVVRQF